MKFHGLQIQTRNDRARGRMRHFPTRACSYAMAVFLSPRATTLRQSPPAVVARSTAREDLARDVSDDEEEVMGTATKPMQSPRAHAERTSEGDACALAKKLEFDGDSPAQETRDGTVDDSGVPEVSEVPGPTVVDTPQPATSVKPRARHQKWRKEHDEQLEAIVKQHLMTNLPLNDAWHEACIRIDRMHGHSEKSSRRPCPACEDRWHKVIKVRLEGDETMKNWWWTESYGRSRQVARGTKRKFVEEDEDTAESESESEYEEIDAESEEEEKRPVSIDNDSMPLSVDDISVQVFDKTADLVKAWKRVRSLLYYHPEFDRTCWNRIVPEGVREHVGGDATPMDFKDSFLYLNSFEVIMHQITYLREAMDDPEQAANDFNPHMQAFQNCARIPLEWKITMYREMYEKHNFEEWLKLAAENFRRSLKHRFGHVYYRETDTTTLSEGQLHEIEFYHVMDNALRDAGVYEGTRHDKLAPHYSRNEYQSNYHEERLRALYTTNEDAIRSGNNRGRGQLCIGPGE